MFDGQILVCYVTNFNRGFKIFVYLYIYIYGAVQSKFGYYERTHTPHKNQRASVSLLQ